MVDPTPPSSTWRERGRRAASATARAFRAYATWLVGISWKRFFLLSILLIVAAAILQSLPPFSTIAGDKPARRVAKAAKPASAPGERGALEITIDERGVRIVPRAGSAASAASAASSPAVQITLPPGLDEAVRETVREAVNEAVNEAEQKAERAAAGDAPGIVVGVSSPWHREDLLLDLALLWIVASIIVKVSYKGRIQAEARAAIATETAEAESLKRQVVEARMAAMQAQVEPHFLFNTLASIDHLIETDPPRASRMQKNLIALLRASMPSLREAGAAVPRDLAHELDVVRPYLEILKMRMDERLQVRIDVPDGLLSAEFPPMMIQGLVENAIKHGLEPKAEGGELRVAAQVVHGKLQVVVADTGLGFGRAPTHGTGTGLANLRERLALLYGAAGALDVAENAPAGTRVTITVPYRSLDRP